MSHNTWLHRIARTTIVQPLAGTAVTPNQLTTARLASGIAAAGLLAIGPAWFIAGATVFAMAMLLDRADGDLARSTGQTSAAGHRYDLASDAACNTLVFVGLGIGLRDGEHGLLAIAMGTLAGIAVAIILGMVMRLEASGGERAGEIGGAAGFDPDDAMLAIPVALWLGWHDGLLLAAAIGAPAFAVAFALGFRRKLWPADAS